MDLKTVTPFRQKVYRALLRIPRGKVTTYRALGRAINCASPRAIGQALKNNPFAPEVPCHRVVRSDRTLGGFAGKTEGPEIQRKLSLLKKEGVKINDGVIDASCVCERF